MKRKYAYCVVKMKWPGQGTLYFTSKRLIINNAPIEIIKEGAIIKQFKYWDDAQTFANLMNIDKRVL